MLLLLLFQVRLFSASIDTFSVITLAGVYFCILVLAFPFSWKMGFVFFVC